VFYVAESSQSLQESPGLKWEWEHYLKLEDLVSKIRERESSRDGSNVKSENGTLSSSSPVKNESTSKTMDDNRRSQSFPAFVEWLRNNKVNPDKVEISHIGSAVGYGLKTTTPLKSGETVFTIPRSVIITSDVARESKLSECSFHFYCF